MHEFVAEENTCFFDICLPNYTADSLRRITYFNEIGPIVTDKASETNGIDIKDCRSEDFADQTLQLSRSIDGLTTLEFDTTPPKLPVDFEIADLPYRGEMGI